MEVMSARCDDLLPHLRAALEHGELAANLRHSNRVVADPGGVRVDDPDPGPFPLIIDRAKRDLRRGDHLWPGDFQRYRRAERRQSALAVEDIASLVGACKRVCGIGKLPQMRDDGDVTAVERRLGLTAERR